MNRQSYCIRLLTRAYTIPNHDIGCELADFSDIRWTVERLSMHPIGKVDAVTVAAGISHLEKAGAVSG